MATFKIHDKVDEFRVELIGRFAGACVHELRTSWQKALSKTIAPQFTVDLTRACGCDAEGRKLLRDMHQHGTQFAAGTPDALVLLREISSPVRPGPTVIQPSLVKPGTSSRRSNSGAAGPLARPKVAGR